LDLSKARSTFKELTQKNWITNTVIFFRLLFGERKCTRTFLKRNQNFRGNLFFEEIAFRSEIIGSIVTWITDNLNSVSVHKDTYIHNPEGVFSTVEAVRIC
jgi:hypothetical protein